MHKLDLFQVFADGSRNLLFAWIPSYSVSGHPCAPFYAERTWQGTSSILKLVQHGPKRETRCAPLSGEFNGAFLWPDSAATAPYAPPLAA